MQAWCNLTPENASGTNGELYGDELPEVSDEHCYLIEFLYQIGVAGRGMDGIVPLTFLEIEAWSRMRGADLTGYEAETIRALSVAYCAIANDRDAECPIQDGDVYEQVQDVSVQSWMMAAN